MATILQLAKPPEQKLVKLEAQLERNEQEFRLVFVSHKVRERLGNEVPAWNSQWNLAQTPYEQFSALMSRFISGDVLIFDHDFNALHKYENKVRNYDDGIWELKTADVRLFGWFCKFDCFVGVCIDEAWRVKSSGLYAGYRDQVIRFRNALELDEPKFIPGGEPVNVVSNFCPA